MLKYLVIAAFLIFLPAHGQTCFSSFTIAPGSTAPYRVHCADLNVDGKMDLVYTNLYGNSLMVWFGSGAGTFSLHATYPLTGAVRECVIADFDKDGHPDLAAAVGTTGSSDYIQIFSGQAGGNFTPTNQLHSKVLQPCLAAGDLNGDGSADLIANVSGSLYVYMNSGNGTFQSPVTYSNGTQAATIVCRDINGDGFHDVLTSRFNTNDITVFLSASTGVLSHIATLATNVTPLGIELTDLNGDGKLDFMNSTYYDISLFTGDGTGQFTHVVSYPVGMNPSSIICKDIDGDHAADIVFSGYQASKVGYLKCVGTMSYVLASQTFTTGKNPYSLASADFDGDQEPDFVTANVTGDNLSVLLNRRIRIKTPPAACKGEMIFVSASGTDTHVWTHSGTASKTFTFILNGTQIFHVSGHTGSCTTTAQAQVSLLNCTGINETRRLMTNVYPNPGTGPFTVESSEEAILQLTDIYGRLVWKGMIGAGSAVILDLTHPGVYFLFSSGSEKAVKIIRN